MNLKFKVIIRNNKTGKRETWKFDESYTLEDVIHFVRNQEVLKIIIK